MCTDLFSLQTERIVGVIVEILTTEARQEALGPRQHSQFSRVSFAAYVTDHCW
jgi:hypothetical protein